MPITKFGLMIYVSGSLTHIYLFYTQDSYSRLREVITLRSSLTFSQVTPEEPLFFHKILFFPS